MEQRWPLGVNELGNRGIVEWTKKCWRGERNILYFGIGISNISQGFRYQLEAIRDYFNPVSLNSFCFLLCGS